MCGSPCFRGLKSLCRRMKRARPETFRAGCGKLSGGHKTFRGLCGTFSGGHKTFRGLCGSFSGVPETSADCAARFRGSRKPARIVRQRFCRTRGNDEGFPPSLAPGEILRNGEETNQRKVPLDCRTGRQRARSSPFPRPESSSWAIRPALPALPLAATRHRGRHNGSESIHHVPTDENRGHTKRHPRFGPPERNRPSFHRHTQPPGAEHPLLLDKTRPTGESRTRGFQRMQLKSSFFLFFFI